MSDGDAESRARDTVAGLDLESRIELLLAPAFTADGSGSRFSSADATGPLSQPAALWIDGSQVSGVPSPTGVASTNAARPLHLASFEYAARQLHPASVLTFAELLLRADPDDAEHLVEQSQAAAEALGVDLLFAKLPSPGDFSRSPGNPAENVVEKLERILTDAAERPILALSLPPLSDSAVPDPNRYAISTGALLHALSDEVAALHFVAQPDSLSVDIEGRSRLAAQVAGVRRDLGFGGLVVADVRGTRDSTRIGEVIEVLRAGADLLIISTDRGRCVEAIVAAVGSGELSADAIRRSAERVVALTLRADRGTALSSDSAAARLERLQEEPPPPTLMQKRADPPLPLVSPDFAGMSEADLAEVDDAIRGALEDSVMTAAAVAIGRNGMLVHLRGFGNLDGREIDPRTSLFDLASLSKVVGTATAAALLVDSGELDLDAPVRRYLRRFRGEGKDDVTIRHLLSHTSGLPAGLWVYGSADSPEEAIDQIVRQDLVRDPGQEDEYSDLGMIILAEVIAETAGEPLDELLSRRVFAPLGMDRTMYSPPLSAWNEVVPTAATSERPYTLRGVVHDGNAFRLGGVAGHAGIFSTAYDVALFAQMMLDGGTLGGVRILSDSVVAEFTREQPGAGERALGWDTPADRSSAGRFFSSRSYGHTGYTGTSIWIDPLRDLFVVLLTNRTYPDASPGEILDLRIDVHEAAVQAIGDIDISRRPGSR